MLTLHGVVIEFMNKEDVVKEIKEEYGRGIFTFTEIMFKKSYNPEEFGAIIQSLIDEKTIIPSIGGASFTMVNTKRGLTFVGFDIFNEEVWNRFKRGYYSNGFTNKMREMILRLHKSINRKAGNYPMDYGRLNI